MVLRRKAALLFLLCWSNAFEFLPPAHAQVSRQQDSLDPIPVPSLPRQCKLAGRVLYADNLEAAEGVLVKLFEGGVPRAQVYTTAMGRFEFRSLFKKSFEVEVSVKGYKVARVTADLSFHCRQEMVTVLLEPKNQLTPAAPEGATISVRELKIPDKARQAFVKGLQELNEKKRADRSVKHFRKAIELYPKYDQAYIQLALAHLALHEQPQAQQVLEKATEVNQKHGRAFVLLGIVHGQQGHAEESVEALKQAVRLEENDWLAQFELGSALLRQALTEEAYIHAQRAHELNPRFPSTHLLLYEISMQRKDYEAALAEADEFLELFPDASSAPQLRQRQEALRKYLAARAN